MSKRSSTATWQHGNVTVFTTWEVLYVAIVNNHPDAVELLSLCSLLASVDIPDQVFFVAMGMDALDPVTIGYL
jgi:hypothetical protein